MRFVVDIATRTARSIEDREGGLPPIVQEAAIAMPATEAGIVRIGWDDAEPHVETDGAFAQEVQRGRGVISYAEEGGGIRNEALLDRAIAEPYMAALVSAVVARDAAAAAQAALEAAAATTAPVVGPGFTR